MNRTPLLACVFWCSVAAAQTELHIATNGSNENSGTEISPFASLERARDAIRILKKTSGLPRGGVTVWIHQGDYSLRQNVAFTQQDSGDVEHPIAYRAVTGDDVRILGGRVLPVSVFQPVVATDVLARLEESVRTRVLHVALRTVDISEFGTYPDIFGGAAFVPELFFNDERMTLARWPNDGWANFNKVIESGPAPWRNHSSDKLGIFEFPSERLARWRTAPAVWLNGYWCFDWRCETIRVSAIDVERNQITLANPHVYGLGSGNSGPRRFYAVNLLEELDQAGEYFLDREAGALYFLPPGPLDQSHIVLSTLGIPPLTKELVINSRFGTPVLSLQSVSHVTLRGLTIMDCIGAGIVITDGHDNQIVACRVRNTGTVGIAVEGGMRHRVVACDIFDTGTAGLRISGGDRRTLTSCEHQALNNHIHHVSRRQRTHTLHVDISGVGVRVANNLIHDGPHQAIGITGNDHLIELNEIHHIGMDSDDCGAFYMGRNPSERGSILRHNYWHDLSGTHATASCSIYFDDGAGGQLVSGNVFYRAAGKSFGAVFVHDGHDNVVDNNIFIDCEIAVEESECSDAVWKSMLRGETFQRALLQDVDITRPPYIERYPELRGYLDYDGGPRLNHATRNVVVNCGKSFPTGWHESDNFVTASDPGFMNAKAQDFRLRHDAEVFRKIPGFQQIPFEQMGNVRDELRQEVERH